MKQDSRREEVYREVQAARDCNRRLLQRAHDEPTPATACTVYEQAEPAV